MAAEEKKVDLSTVPLNWDEVYYTNCPLVSASNVDQELGWTREEFKKIGVKYAFLRSRRENNWYPHYIHNLDNLIRFGGLFPPVHVHADIRRTRLLGATHAPHEGGCMLVRARDDIYRMTELKGKKIGLTKSLNTIKNDWWRIQEEQGIELMLRMNGMTRDDVEIVEFPYPDDWYDKPEMLDPMENPSELWLKRDHKHDLAFRPLETALEKGIVDAIYTQSKPFQHLQEATGKFKAIEDLSRYPDWTLQVANIPAVITCTDEMAEEHPELVVTFMKGMIKVGRWANEHKHAAAAILDKQTFYLRRRGHLPGHQAHRHGAQPVAAEPGLDRDRQGLHAQPRLHQERLRRARVGRAGVPRAGRQGAARGGVDAARARRSCPRRPSCRFRRRGSGSRQALRRGRRDRTDSIPPRPLQRADTEPSSFPRLRSSPFRLASAWTRVRVSDHLVTSAPIASRLLERRRRPGGRDPAASH